MACARVRGYPIRLHSCSTDFRYRLNATVQGSSTSRPAPDRCPLPNGEFNTPYVCCGSILADRRPGLLAPEPPSGIVKVENFASSD